MGKCLTVAIFDITNYTRKLLSPSCQSAILLQDMVRGYFGALLCIYYGGHILNDCRQFRLLSICCS
jgi:hypothetical protein